MPATELSQPPDEIEIASMLTALRPVPMLLDIGRRLAFQRDALKDEVASLRHACLAAIGFLSGSSVIKTQEKMKGILADAVRYYVTAPKPKDEVERGQKHDRT